uniref:Leucine rich repeat protein n=1 Tax=Pithovirus LCPAC202 TaxID=2506592 RepID=A0A481Z5C9_9VIRU|nr:MAG: leucine rich repeat protein [Pithovirus LCPAC202]
MHFSIIRRGDKKATLVYSMPDAWDGSVDISKGKANTAVSFSSDQNALTSRTIGVASQPGSPLWQIGNSNLVGGIIEFPGGIPLYKNNILVGAIGVSGDGVDQDESVASSAAKGYGPKDFIRSDKVVNLPYLNDKSVEVLPIRTAPPRKGELIINYPGQVPFTGPIRIIGSKEWSEYLINNPLIPDATIQLFYSGDRKINSLYSLIPYAKNFATINFFHSTISNLTGLDKFTNLKSLNLSRTEINNSQLLYLSSLTQLERLELNGNDINNLSAISGLNPNHLGLACLQITNLQPLVKMTNLVILDLYQNPELVNILALGSLTSLRDLDIRKTRIDPSSIKSTLPNLTRFVHD